MSEHAEWLDDLYDEGSDFSFGEGVPQTGVFDFDQRYQLPTGEIVTGRDLVVAAGEEQGRALAAQQIPALTAAFIEQLPADQQQFVYAQLGSLETELAREAGMTEIVTAARNANHVTDANDVAEAAVDAALAQHPELDGDAASHYREAITHYAAEILDQTEGDAFLAAEMAAETLLSPAGQALLKLSADVEKVTGKDYSDLIRLHGIKEDVEQIVASAESGDVPVVPGPNLGVAGRGPVEQAVSVRPGEEEADARAFAREGTTIPNNGSGDAYDAVIAAHAEGDQ